MCVCVCERQRQRDRHRQTDKPLEPERQAHRHTDKRTETKKVAVTVEDNYSDHSSIGTSHWRLVLLGRPGHARLVSQIIKMYAEIKIHRERSAVSTFFPTPSKGLQQVLRVSTRILHFFVQLAQCRSSSSSS